MKFGVNLINFGPAATPESLARTAALAEALGYHFVMTSPSRSSICAERHCARSS